MPAPKLRKIHVPAKRQARVLVNDSSDDDGGLSDGGDMCCDASDDTLDQDEDVIRAAEEAQEADLNDAAESAGLEVTVMDNEQKAASTALSKASVAIFNFNKHLLIMLDSSRDLHTRSTTLLAFLKRCMHRVLLPRSSRCV